MENEQTLPSYWPSVFVAGLITAIIYSVVGLISQYTMLSNPSVGQILGYFVCLLGAIGGIIGNWHYAKEHNVTYKIGRGALIGLFTGVIAVLFGTVINLIWTAIIDPDLNQAIYDAQMASMESQNMTQEQLEMAQSFVPKPGTSMYYISTVGFGLLALGIINTITGLIGAKIFASEE